jgi:hypothetical protein
MEKVAAMYKIHAGCFVEPFFFSVINLEIEIRRNPSIMSITTLIRFCISKSSSKPQGDCIFLLAKSSVDIPGGLDRA